MFYHSIQRLLIKDWKISYLFPCGDPISPVDQGVDDDDENKIIYFGFLVFAFSCLKLVRPQIKLGRWAVPLAALHILK
jgi:hypothetical protein